MRTAFAISLVVFSLPLVLADRTETETFEGGYVNPYFTHELDSSECCVEFVLRPETGSQMYHLFGNSDAIRGAGIFEEFISSIRVDILDFEGAGGDTPTSVLLVQGSFGDIVIRQATQIGVVQTVEVTEDTPGQFSGFPIGPILGLRLQAFADGNSVFPGEVGAYFDNLNAEIREFGPPCPGDLDGDLDVDLTDLATLLGHFGTPSGAVYEDGDVDMDGDIDLEDLTLMLSNFGAAC